MKIRCFTARDTASLLRERAGKQLEWWRSPHHRPCLWLSISNTSLGDQRGHEKMFSHSLTKGKIKARISAFLYRQTPTWKSQDSHVHWLEFKPGAASERHSWKPLATPKMFTHQSRKLSPEAFPENVCHEIVCCCKHTGMHGHKLKRQARKAGY